MINIITALEARAVLEALSTAKEILTDEGYDDEAQLCYDAEIIIGSLEAREIEEIIK